MLDKHIFDADKNYQTSTGSLFLESNPGLFDSINKRMPTIWALYKKLKSLDWDENEQNYKDCQVEFITGNKEDIDKMITTLAWQWETDSVAAHHIVPLYASFVSSSELWAALCRVQDNEVLHGLTYSEIIRGSFENPDDVMKRVLQSLEPLKRLKTVADVLSEVKRTGALLTLGELSPNSNEARDAVMLMAITMFAMERIQFMASFAITFAFAESGRFVPIGKIVQKICNDEFNIHVEIGREIIRNELSIEVGKKSFERIKSRVETILKELIQSELTFTTDYLFADGKQLVGCNAELICNFVLFSATDVYNELGIENPFGNVTKNPIGYMEDWVNLDNNQAAPQEEKTVNYLLGGFVSTAGDKVFDTEGL